MSNSETYIVTAKTVDEAMSIANREYGGAGKDITFDILEMPKKGFLGIGARDAKIKVTVTEEEEINLGSIVAEMKSYRMKTDRDGEDKPRREQKQKADKPQQEKQPKPEQKKPQEKPAQNHQKADKPRADAPKQNQPKSEKPAQQNAPRADKPQQNPPKGDKPQQPRQERQPKPEQPKQNVQKADKPARAEVKAEPKIEAKAEPVKEVREAKEAPAPEVRAEAAKPAPKAEKPTKTEAQASGILDSMPEYRITESGKKTPVYKETGANVKTYSRSPMQTAAVADGSIGSGDTPVADVRWDSARDLKKAEAAAAAAIAAAAPKTVEPLKAADIEKAVQSALEPLDDEYGSSDRYAQYKAEADEAGKVDVAAIDAAIEAMVEELPAPETRRKVGVTAVEMEYALRFTNTLLSNMQIDARAVAVDAPEGEEYEITEDANLYPAIEIVGEGTGILIGHHGETLDAIQYLLNLAAIRHSDNQSGDYVKISLDIENYRAKREETLRSLARRMAARALKYKRNVFLEPMNAYERRIIHSELQGVENVSTHSVGSDKNRKIIITYEGADKSFEDKRADRRREENSESAGRRDRNRRRGDRKQHTPAAPAAPAETVESAEAGTEENAAVQDRPQGESRSRRSRNRNRNRSRNRQNSGEGTAETAEAPVTGGASAIMTGAEKEEFDRQLSEVPHPEAHPVKREVENVPEFLKQSADEPVEHLREN